MKNLFIVAIIVCLGVYGHARPKDSLNRFSSALYKELSQIQSGNKVVSPYVTYMGLLMLCFGARGDTQKEFNHVLGMKCEDLQAGAAFHRLKNLKNRMKRSNQSNDVQLGLGAKIFISNTKKINKEYERYMKEHYTSVESVDFSNSKQAADLINRWVDMETNHNIPKLFDAGSFDKTTAMVFATAISFHATWENEFNRIDELLPFKNDKVEEEVPFMSTKQKFTAGYVDDLNARFIQVPYKHNEFSMVIFLPDEDKKLEDLENKFTEVSTSEILKTGKEVYYELVMPKFKIESSFELDSALQKMGMHHAYKDVDFSGICSTNMRLSKSLHKAVITVDEQGTDAAAASGFEMFFRSFAPQAKLFTVNRPFLFVILDEPIGIDFFVGSVYNPKMQ